MMWAGDGCRGLFQCAKMNSVLCDAPWGARRNCSCLPCHDVPSQSGGGAAGFHCCADNGATLSHGTWEAADPTNANVDACRNKCAETPGCTHYSFSSAIGECADDLWKQSHGFGRCGLCGACTQRPNVRNWQRSYTSYELAPSPPQSPLLKAASHRETLPALIISGCDKRYERAAAVARSLGFSPSWLVGVFKQNVLQAPKCPWPTANERNLLMAHRNAWHLIANANISMAVLEDDIEIGHAASAASVQREIAQCEESYSQGPWQLRASVPFSASWSPRCELLFLGYVDAFWATHALWITPSAARRLLKDSHKWCPEPTDYYTHRFCSTQNRWTTDKQEAAEYVATWHKDQKLASRCRMPGAGDGNGNGDETSSWLKWVGLGGGRATNGVKLRMRPPELYGVGLLVQNRTRGYIHRLRGFGGADASGEGQGVNC